MTVSTDNRQPKTDNHPPIQFGLVGCGRVSSTHFDAIHALGEKGHLIAVCDDDPAQLSKAVESTGAQGYSTLAEMLRNPEVDIVSICTPSGMHAEHGIKAAEAGKHVIVEKPMDVTLEKAKSLINACERNGVQLFPIFQNRLNTTVQLAKAAVDKGRFGKIYAINATMIWKRGQDYYDADAWRGTRAMDGGCFMNQGIHFVDAMHYLGGEITEVKSTLATLARDIECEDIGSALFRFESGALGNIFVTTLGRYDQEGSIMILGEKGQIKIGGTCLNSIETWDFDEPDSEMDAKAKDADYQSKSVYGFGHKKFYEMVVSGAFDTPNAPHPPRMSLFSLDVIHQIYSSEYT